MSKSASQMMFFNQRCHFYSVRFQTELKELSEEIMKRDENLAKEGKTTAVYEVLNPQHIPNSISL